MRGRSAASPAFRIRNLAEDADCATRKASLALAARQHNDGHWVFELEADVTIPAEYILLKHYLGEPTDPLIDDKIGRYLRRTQGPHDGWSLFHDGAFDVSASVKAYFALKLIGDDPQAPHMVRARKAIHAAGGAEAVNVFTRIQLALFGAGSWDRVPTMPVELMLLPRWFPVHLSKMAYWARTVIVPLLVLAAKRPVARNPLGMTVDELYAGSNAPLRRQTDDHRRRYWQIFFDQLDRVLKRATPLWPEQRRNRAIAACEAFVLERLNGEDGLGAIYPAMANAVMMLDCLGYPPEHPARETARIAIEKLLVIKDEEAYCQPCVSPVWDTALSAHALLEAGDPQSEAMATRALDWLKARQILDVEGDWAEERPGVRPGGWAFQYENAHYPDLDDTAVVVMAMDRIRGRQTVDYDEAVSRGVEWTGALQSRNGGWGAFDVDNTYYYLNHIPFADHGALLDPPTADVTARCLSMFAQLGDTPESPRMVRALAYLTREQMPDGSWFGRWGVNYIYGTWSVLCALNAAGLAHDHPMMTRAATWLRNTQNADGGWGEDCTSYALDYKHYTPAPSTASQTAWAVLGLMAAGAVDEPAVESGIRWLIDHQNEEGLWTQDHYTGGGFPRVFYLRYHGYPAYFPLWAVARYRNLKRGNGARVAFGM